MLVWASTAPTMPGAAEAGAAMPTAPSAAKAAIAKKDFLMGGFLVGCWWLIFVLSRHGERLGPLAATRNRPASRSVPLVRSLLMRMDKEGFSSYQSSGGLDTCRVTPVGINKLARCGCGQRPRGHQLPSREVGGPGTHRSPQWRGSYNRPPGSRGETTELTLTPYPFRIEGQGVEEPGHRRCVHPPKKRLGAAA